MNIKKTFEPVFDENSKILILGTFPSPLSFVNGFYYGNPRNRFWQVLSKIVRSPLPETNSEKRTFLIEHKIALWDVLETCDIKGAADSTICNEVPNDIAALLEKTSVAKIYCNGATAHRLFLKFCPACNIECAKMPSTSPANAAWNLERLISEWSSIGSQIF